MARLSVLSMDLAEYPLAGWWLLSQPQVSCQLTGVLMFCVPTRMECRWVVLVLQVAVAWDTSWSRPRPSSWAPSVGHYLWVLTSRPLTSSSI